MAKHPATFDDEYYVLRHLRFGWCAVLCFLTLGITLEILHGFKVRWYLDAGNETRRLMWTLAHAHGTLFAVLCLVLPGLPRARQMTLVQRVRVDRLLATGAACLPWGFFLGGLQHYESDPGPGVFLVPVAGLVFAVGLVLLIFSPRS